MSTAAVGGCAGYGRLPAAAVSPPLLKGCGGVRGGPRPSGWHPAAPRTVAVSGSADTGWASRPGPRRRRAPDGPDASTVDAGCGQRQPQAPSAADTATAVAPCSPAAAPRWTAGTSTVPCHSDIRPGAGPQGAAAASTRLGLTATSVAWCSASIWSAPDGSGLLTLDAASIQTDRDGSSRIVRMINGMIKRPGGRRFGRPGYRRPAMASNARRIVSSTARPSSTAA